MVYFDLATIIMPGQHFVSLLGFVHYISFAIAIAQKNQNTVLRFDITHYIILYYTILHYTTLHYTTLHYTTIHYNKLHFNAIHPTKLHYWK